MSLVERPNAVILGGRPINLTALGKQQKISPSYLSHILAGRRNPSTRTIRKIASGLGMSVDALLAALDEAQRDHRRKKEAEAKEREKRWGKSRR